MTLDEVMNATSDSLDSGLLRFSDGAFIGKGGFVETGGLRLNVRNEIGINTPADLGKIVIERRDGKRLRVSDVATLKEDHQPLGGDAVVNSGPGLLLVVQKYPGANTLELTKGLEEAMDAMRPGLPDVKIDTTIFRPATFIETAIHNLTTTLLLGCLLVVAILAAFLFEWRTAMISLIAIPLSLVAAIVFLDLYGTTINVMLLAGLVVAVGVVVDDAIIDVENVTRRLRQHRATGRRGLGRGGDPEGVAGGAELDHLRDADHPRRRRPGAPAERPVGLVLPAARARLRPGRARLDARRADDHPGAVPDPAAQRAAQAPVAAAGRAQARVRGDPVARHPHAAPGARASRRSLMLAGVLVAPTLGSSLFPSFKERDFLLHWINKPSTSQPEQARIVTRGCNDLRKVPGVRNCGSHIGQAFLAEETEGVNFGENWISIRPKADYDKTIAAVQKTADSYPGIYRNVQTYLRERISESLTGTSNAVVVRIFGPDLDVIGEKAKEVAKSISDVPGVVDAHSELHENVPHIQVEVKLAQARRYGLKPGDIRRQSATLLASEEVGDIFRGGRAYDVHVWSIPSVRRSVDDVRKLPLDIPGGGHVRLADVATIKVAPTPNTIERESESRLIQVGANVSGRDLSSVVDDIEARVAKVSLPAGLPRGGRRRVDRARGRPVEPRAVRPRRGDRDLPAPAVGVLERAAGRADLPHAADGARRRGAGGEAVGRRAVARLARRVPHGVRDLRPQQHPDDQPLPAPRARGGRGLRSRARDARCDRAAGADPHDGVGDRPRARPARDRRPDLGPRDRVSDGGRDPRRARHVDAAEPVRDALAVPALRAAKAAGAGGGRGPRGGQQDRVPASV